MMLEVILLLIKSTAPLLLINRVLSESVCPSVRSVHSLCWKYYFQYFCCNPFQYVFFLVPQNSWNGLCNYLLCQNRSLERKLQRPLLAKSRTLPSIPQSPTVSRVHQSDLIGGSPLRRKTQPATTSNLKACTLPPAGKLPLNSISVNVYKRRFFFSANMSLFPLYFNTSGSVWIMLCESTHWQRRSIHVVVRTQPCPGLLKDDSGTL